MKILVMLVLLFGPPAETEQTVELSLDDALRIGMEKNRTIGMASSAVERSEALAGIENSRLYPGLFLTGGYTRLEDGPFRLSTTNLPQPVSVGNVVVDNYLLRAGLRQPLFTGFRLSSMAEMADLQAEATRLDRSSAKQRIVLEITSAYWILYQARRQVQFTRENIRRLESYLADTEHMLRSGLLTESDRLKIEVRLSNARIAEIETSNGEQLAEMRLASIVGLPVGTRIRLTSSPGPADGTTYANEVTADSLLAAARVSRPDLLAAVTRSEAADAGVRAAHGWWWPQIELTAGYQYNNPNSRYQPITPEFLGNWDVGVSVTMDIWNWGGTGSRVQSAVADLRQSELTRLQIEDEIAVEVRSSVLNIRAAAGKVAVAELVVRQSEEGLRVARDKYRAGVVSSTDLLDAEVDLLDAQTQLTGAMVEYAIARSDLNRAVGSNPGPADE